MIKLITIYIISNNPIICKKCDQEDCYCKNKSKTFNKNKCTRCGREGHYSNECYAKTNIDKEEIEESSEEEIEEIFCCSYCDKEFETVKGVTCHQNLYCKHKIIKKDIIINEYSNNSIVNIVSDNDNLIKFIKQFNTIPNTFIDDFFTFYSYNTTDEDIIIDLSIVAKWLNILKENLKKVLVKNFEENFDYTIEKKKKKQINSRGATIYELILITPKCFKELCLISQTSKAKEIRKYFIELEKYFIYLSTNEIDQNENNLLDV